MDTLCWRQWHVSVEIDGIRMHNEYGQDADHTYPWGQDTVVPGNWEECRATWRVSYLTAADLEAMFCHLLVEADSDTYSFETRYD